MGIAESIIVLARLKPLDGVGIFSELIGLGIRIFTWPYLSFVRWRNMRKLQQLPKISPAEALRLQ